MGKSTAYYAPPGNIKLRTTMSTSIYILPGHNLPKPPATSWSDMLCYPASSNPQFLLGQKNLKLYDEP